MNQRNVTYDRLCARFASLATTALRSQFSSSSFFQMDGFLHSLQRSLRDTLGTPYAWVLSVESPATRASSRKDREEQYLVFRSPFVGRQRGGVGPSSLLARPCTTKEFYKQYWLFAIPAFVDRSRTESQAEYVFVVRQTPELCTLSQVGFSISTDSMPKEPEDPQATVMPRPATRKYPIPQGALEPFFGFVQSISGTLLSHAQHMRSYTDGQKLLSRDALRRRSADDYLAIAILKLAKSILPDWQSLSLWRVSRTKGDFERIAQERVSLQIGRAHV